MAAVAAAAAAAAAGGGGDGGGGGAGGCRHLDRLVDACAVVGITLESPLAAAAAAAGGDEDEEGDPFDEVYHAFAVETVVQVRVPQRGGALLGQRRQR